MTAVGVVHSTRSASIDDGWDAIAASIVLDETQFTAEALAGLDAFSHVEVVYLFDRVDPAETGKRAPPAEQHRLARGGDLKPWVHEFGPRGEVRQPPWISELMRAYW